MTIVRSASGIRIDCDRCEHHTGARALSVDELRYATGYVSHRGHDLCPSCGRSLTAARFQTPTATRTDDGPAAA